METGALKNTFEHTGAVQSVSFSPDGITLAVGSTDETVRLWDVETGNPIETLTGHIYDISSVAYAPDGTTLAAGGHDSKVRLWDVATGTLKNTLENGNIVRSVSFSPDGSILASAGGHEVRLWDVETGTLKNVIRGDIEAFYGVYSISFRPDGTTLAAGNGDGTVHLWDVATGTLIKILKENHAIDYDYDVFSVSFSPDGTTVASGSTDGIVRLWNVETGTLIRTPKGPPAFEYNSVFSVSFSPDGTTLAAAGGHEIGLWDVATGALIRILQGQIFSIKNVSFSPDGTTLASASADSNVALWDVATGTLKKTLTGHTAIVRSVSFSPDGTTLVSGGGVDGTVFFWELISAVPEPETIAEDVNADGVVNIQDLVLVAANLGETGENAADVNSDGVVNIQDLVLVAAALGQTTAAPSIRPSVLEQLNANDLRQWIQKAQQENLTDLTFQRGVQVLEQLLSVLAPKETALLANYPNPFNPETWIPYQLAKSASITVSIHSADGTLVRRLTLGNRSAGIYQSHSRAAYWDGRNEVGEPIASGIYFYTLSAGDFTATRKMVILK